jgi:hypothetical protein
MSTDRTEIQSLMQRWRKKNGHPMPIEIARLPIEKIRKAVRLTEAGTVVCVPPGLSLGEASKPIDMNDDSLMYWDRNSEN